MSYVNKSLQKKDAMALVTGKPVYTDDLAPKDCLIIPMPMPGWKRSRRTQP